MPLLFWELFFLSSVIITKPGGLTVFEGIFMRKPFIFSHYIPGQEKGNMDVLIGNDVARFARNADELLDAVDYFKEKSTALMGDYPLRIGDIRSKMGERARR